MAKLNFAYVLENAFKRKRAYSEFLSDAKAALNFSRDRGMMSIYIQLPFFTVLVWIKDIFLAISFLTFELFTALFF